MNEIKLNFMDDMHFHPRTNGEITTMVMQHLWAAGFRRGIPIFNYEDPVETAYDLDQERKRLFDIDPHFEFIWSIMLTKNTTPQILFEAYSAGARVVKWIPNNLSTNSKNGVSWTNIEEKYPCFQMADKLGMRVMIHAEDSFLNNHGSPITHPLFREGLAIPKFDKLARSFPDLLFTFEHISTKNGVDYVLYQSPSNVFATITAHHLIGEVSDVYKLHDGIERIVPKMWCMPILKYPYDRESLREAAISGSKKFFYGSDKAPHKNKDIYSPTAGSYSGPNDISLLAEIFEAYDAIDKLNNFISGFGADYYGLPRNEGAIILRKEEWIAPEEINSVEIFCGGKIMSWKVV